LRILCINLAAVIFALGIAESWFGLLVDRSPEQTYSGDYTGDYFVDHPVFGYGPQRDVSASAGLTVDGKRIYETRYGIGPDGLRATPAAPAAESAVLFFGGSFTFGEGVSDEQSMPYRVARLMGSGIRVHNFGFHGYGPHQMLAALESGIAESIVEKPVRAVVYQGIVDHVHRAAGRAFWDRSGPRYVLTESGLARYAGHFDDGRGEFEQWLLKKLSKSALYQRMFGVQSAITDSDVRLYGAIVGRSRDLLLSRFPDAEFHVLLWGYREDETFRSVRKALIKRGLIVHAVSDILPDFEEHPERYQLDRLDTHPNALAHDSIARYVADEILAGTIRE
jgi:hypothetical protein